MALPRKRIAIKRRRPLGLTFDLGVPQDLSRNWLKPPRVEKFAQVTSKLTPEKNRPANASNPKTASINRKQSTNIRLRTCFDSAMISDKGTLNARQRESPPTLQA